MIYGYRLFYMDIRYNCTQSDSLWFVCSTPYFESTQRPILPSWPRPTTLSFGLPMGDAVGDRLPNSPTKPLDGDKGGVIGGEDLILHSLGWESLRPRKILLKKESDQGVNMRKWSIRIWLTIKIIVLPTKNIIPFNHPETMICSHYNYDLPPICDHQGKNI